MIFAPSRFGWNVPQQGMRAGMLACVLLLAAVPSVLAQDLRETEADQNQVMALCATGQYDAVIATVNGVKARFVCDQVFTPLRSGGNAPAKLTPAEEIARERMECSLDDRALGLCELTKAQRELRKQALEAVKRRDADPLAAKARAEMRAIVPVVAAKEEEAVKKEAPPPPPTRPVTAADRAKKPVISFDNLMDGGDCPAADAALNLCDLTPSQRAIRRRMLGEPEPPDPKEKAAEARKVNAAASVAAGGRPATFMPTVGTAANPDGTPVGEPAKGAPPKRRN